MEERIRKLEETCETILKFMADKQKKKDEYKNRVYPYYDGLNWWYSPGCCTAIARAEPAIYRCVNKPSTNIIKKNDSSDEQDATEEEDYGFGLFD